MRWTDTEDAMLRQSYNSTPVRILAERLGRTRNAIIGRAQRLGLGQSRPQFSAMQRHARDQERRQRKLVMDRVYHARQRHVGKIMEVRKMTECAKPQKPAPVEPVNGVGLMELQDHHCRSLQGYCTDGLPVYCGKTKLDGTSYCPAHFNLYYWRRPARFFSNGKAA